MSPVRKAKRKVARKVARRVKKAVRRAKRAVKRIVRRVKRDVKRAKRSVKRGKRAVAKRPKLAVVRRPKPRVAKSPPEPQAFAAAKAGASAKDLILFELVRARVAVTAAIQGMSAGSAEMPTEPGKWSSREMVLHLAYWDREMLPALEAAYQHARPLGLSHEKIEEMNPIGHAELRHHDWDSARRLLQLHRERLMEEFQSIPEEPTEVWSREHPVGKLARLLTDHDRQHAEKMKAARTSRGD